MGKRFILGKKNIMNAFCSLLIFAAFFCLLEAKAGEAAGPEVVVKGSVVNIRSGPGTNHPVLGQVKQGERLAATSKAGDWYAVRLPDGKQGWIAGWLVTALGSPLSNSSGSTGQSPGGQPAQQVKEGSGFDGRQAVVKGSVVNVRSGPGTNYPVISQVKVNDRLPVLGKTGEWYKVGLAAGNSGWIAGWLVEIKNLPAPQEGSGNRPQAGDSRLVVKGDGVNIRSGPGTNHGILTQVSRGARLPVLDRQADWYKIQLPGGGSGWIVAWYVAEEPASPPPPQEAPPSAKPAPAPVIPAPGPKENAPQDNNKDPRLPAKNGPQTGQSGEQTAATIKVTVSKEDNLTKVKIVSTQEVTYNIFRLRQPERLVMDLHGARPGELPPELTVDSAAVSRLRIGWFSRDPDITRLVFDLKERAVYKVKATGDQKNVELDIFIPNLKDALAGKKIVLDPGHGGNDPGAIGPTGLKEKEVNLDVARRAYALLGGYGARVVLTRNGDEEIDLYARSQKANAAGADLFVSIHMNANSSPSLKGTSTYYARSGEDKAQRLEKSRQLANELQASLVDALGLEDKGVRQADFVVLRETAIPAVLIEAAFLSNPEEEKLLASASFREKIARAIVEGIGNYFLGSMGS